MEKNRKLSKRVDYAKYGYIFSIPFVVTFLIFQLYPLIFTTSIGFTNMQGPEMLGAGLFSEEVTATWNTVVEGGSALQMSAPEICPTNNPRERHEELCHICIAEAGAPMATNRNVLWSVTPGSGEATIDESGLLTAISTGTVIVRAETTDNSGLYAETEITIQGPIVQARSVTIDGENQIRTITSHMDQRRFHPHFYPADVTTEGVIWSIASGADYGIIFPAAGDNSVLLRAKGLDGTVTLRADSIDGSGVFAELDVIISGQNNTYIPVRGITMATDGLAPARIYDEDYNYIETIMAFDASQGILQMESTVYPADAPQEVNWSIIPVSGDATINARGELAPRTNGIVIVRATESVPANFLADIYAEMEISIVGSADSVPVTAIAVLGGVGDRTLIDIEGSTLRPFHWFIDVFNSSFFRRAFANTLFIWLLNFVPQILLALALAAIFTNKLMNLKGVGFFKIMFYMPNIITAASIALLFSVLFGHPIGPVNDLLVTLGIFDSPENIIVESIFTMTVPFNFEITWSQMIIAFIQFWMWYGVTMIILVAGIMGISPTLFEAAAMDGASHIKSFFYITLPALRTILLFTLVTSFVGGMQMFDIPRMFEDGEPRNTTLTTSLFIFQQAFEGAERYNRAAAASMLMFVFICLFSSVLFYVMRDKDVARERRERKEILRKEMNKKGVA
ncbi:MAG: sugar ABC transporter permease [Defluviitaleaceae bacterium]|nr:sugar ABC transporter permease [Defluviitaleaceae bacterium]